MEDIGNAEVMIQNPEGKDFIFSSLSTFVFIKRIKGWKRDGAEKYNAE